MTRDAAQAPAPFVFTFIFTDGTPGPGGELVACPECGETGPLSITLPLDSAELTDHPSPLVCPWGHQWAESALSRRYVLGPTMAAIVDNPEGWAELQRIATGNGGHATIDLQDEEAR